MTPYMKKYGRDAAANGYDIVPIRPGTKAPLGLKWTDTVTDVETWLTKGFTHQYWIDIAAQKRGTRTWSVADYGIGVLAARSPLVDIDVLDESVSAHMVEFTQELLGKTICRVGFAPKTGLVYRAETPFMKVNSPTFLDNAGRKAKLEVLGSGQQFVALAIHPDTQKPYRWTDKQGVHNTALASLPTITGDQARLIRDEFVRVAQSRGWSVVDQSHDLTRTSGPLDPDDPFADVAPKVTGVSPDEMRRLTMLVPNGGGYDEWREIGMALFHQFDGSDEGLDIWNEWSSNGPNYDSAELMAKWSSFDIDGKGRAPLTARVILERSKAAEEERLVAAVDTAIEAIMLAKSADDLAAACKPYKSVAFSDVTRNMLVGKLQQRYLEVTKTKLPVDHARRMLKYQDSERTGRYSWLDGYVYVQLDDKFYNVKTGRFMSTKAFDASYSRNLLNPVDIAEGKSVPEHLPQHIARNVVQIPVVSNRMYMPGLGDVFSIDGEQFANRFIGIPDAADAIGPAGAEAVARVEAHIRHLFESERDGGLVLDFMAYILQTHDRVNWAIFVQGVGGDGKSFLGDLMTALLGMSNATVIRGAELKEKYTSWAEGSLFVMVEEVRLTGEHRFDAVNNLKPYITNSRVPIRRMNVDGYPVINRSSYLLTSNSKDGLPASEGDRFMILYSRWQDAEKLNAWKRANPSYFVDLFATLNEAPSLRRWLLNRKLSPDFDPRGRAPDTTDLAEMKALVVDDETAALRRMLSEANDADFSRVLMDSGLIAERMTGMGAAAPSGRRLAQLLSQAGMTYIGETGFGGKTRRWWSATPEVFRFNDNTGTRKISGSTVQKHVESWL